MQALQWTRGDERSPLPALWGQASACRVGKGMLGLSAGALHPLRARRHSPSHRRASGEMNRHNNQYTPIFWDLLEAVQVTISRQFTGRGAAR